MTYVAYEPPAPLYDSTISAFQRFTAPSVGVTIDPDPLGPVNKVVSLVVGDHFTNRRRVKSVLWHVPAGAKVQLDRGWVFYPPPKRARSITYDGWRLTAGGSAVDGYRVTVDGRVILSATDAELRPPVPTPTPVPTLTRAHKAARRWLQARPRAVGDRVAGWFGYVHEDEAGQR